MRSRPGLAYTMEHAVSEMHLASTFVTDGSIIELAWRIVL